MVIPKDIWIKIMGEANKKQYFSYTEESYFLSGAKLGWELAQEEMEKRNCDGCDKLTRGFGCSIFASTELAVDEFACVFWQPKEDT